MRTFLVLLMALSATTCTMNRSGNAETLAATAGDDKAPELPSDYFDIQSKCNAACNSLMVDWRSNGGGVKDSIAETRKQIASDQRSRFAAIVRRSWAAQRPEETKSLSDIETWLANIEES